MCHNPQTPAAAAASAEGYGTMKRILPWGWQR